MQGTNLTETQLDKLPKYAQHEIARLAMDLEDARAKLAAGPEDSDTFADPYASVPRPLGKGTTIRFGGLGDQSFNVFWKEGALEVTGNRGSKDAMAVLPCVSNSVILRFVDRG